MSDRDDVEDPNREQGGDPDPDQEESREPDDDEQRSLENRWHHFLSGQAEEERRLRIEKRRARLRGEAAPTKEAQEEGGSAEPSIGSDEEEDASPRFSLDEEDEDPMESGDEREGVSGASEPGADGADETREPRTRAEELKALAEGRSEKDPEAPVVVPAREEMDLPVWRRRWKPIAAGAAVLAAALLVYSGFGDGGSPSPPDAQAPSAAAGASGIDVERVQALTDSLASAIGRYRERKRDYDLNRLDCAGLARGYEAVQSALGELRAAVPDAGDLAAGPLRSRYRSLVSSAETVGEGYAATGCGETS